MIAGGGGPDPHDSNSASGISSTIGGGRENSAIGNHSVVSGGFHNHAVAEFSTIGGGDSNTATGDHSAVGAGSANTCDGFCSIVAGGLFNVCTDSFSVVSGGYHNLASRGGAIGCGEDNYAWKTSAVGGGRSNTASGILSAVSGGRKNHADAPLSTIGGGDSNQAISEWSTIGGGIRNSTRGMGSTVAGGVDNVALNGSSVISGGWGNEAWGSSTIGGGSNNYTTGTLSVIAGGYADTAEGRYATVPGGTGNKAAGKYSLAAGRRAKAQHHGAFVWADSTDADFTSIIGNEFAIRAEWGIRGVASSSAYGASFSNNGNGDGVQAHANVSKGVSWGALYASNTGSSPAISASAGTGLAGYFSGGVSITGNISKGGGASKIDHPLDPENKYLNHSFVESPDMMNVYNGNVVLDANGEATVVMPDWFEALNRDFRYQLTAIGSPGPNLYIAEEIIDGRFSIAGGNSGMKVSWMVTGVRQDKFAEANRIPIEEDKPLADRGLYLHPEAYGLSKDRGIDKVAQEKGK